MNYVVLFTARINNTTLCDIVGRFDNRELAMDYMDQRDRMLDCNARLVPLDPPRFTPDQSYKNA